MTASLTDRYLWAVLRAVPAAQRPDLEREVRALIADAVDARVAAGTSPETAERDALLELGDPETLAARYAGRTPYLIGPRVYPEWRRLLSVLLPVVVPIVSAVVLAARLLGGGTVGEAIVAALLTGGSVAIQTLFWVTLVFALIERTAGDAVRSERPFSPDDLPALPGTGRAGLGELAATLVTNAFVAAAIVWQQVQSPIVVDGRAFPLFDPSLWSFWLPWFLVVIVAEMVFAIARYVRGRWTWPMAVVNTILNAAFAVPAVVLLAQGLLFNPDLVAAIDPDGVWFGVTMTITGIVVVVVTAIDTVQGFQKAWQAERGPVLTEALLG